MSKLNHSFVTRDVIEDSMMGLSKSQATRELNKFFNKYDFNENQQMDMLDICDDLGIDYDSDRLRPLCAEHRLGLITLEGETYCPVCERGKDS